MYIPAKFVTAIKFLLIKPEVTKGAVKFVNIRVIYLYLDKEIIEPTALDSGRPIAPRIPN